MSGRIAARLQELGITLPAPAAPVANYVPFTVSGRVVFISGQVPRRGEAIWPSGKLGGGVSMADGRDGARLCALALLAHLNTATGGDLDRVTRVLRLCGYVASTPDFLQQPQVVNGASDLMVEVFGELGRHARTAIGVAALPGDAAVEVDGFFELA